MSVRAPFPARSLCRHLALLGATWALGAILAVPSQAAPPVASANASANASGRGPAPAPALSQVQVNNAWVRPSVKGQGGTGGFMTLTSPTDLTLVGFSVDAALGQAQLHRMSMQGDVMRMQEVDALSLPAGQRIELRPGAHHLMLVGLQRPLSVGDKIAVTLSLRAPDGLLRQQVVEVPVRSTAPGSPASPASPAPHSHHAH